MDWRWDPAGLAMLGCGLVMVCLVAYVWPRRTAGGLALVAMLAALAEWSLAYGLELSVDPVAAKEVFGALKYAGIGVLAPAWVAFALSYLGREGLLTKRVLGVLMIEPCAVMLLLAIPATHDLMRYYPPGSAAEQYPVVAVGWLFWVHLVYTNLLLLGATGLFVVSLARVSRVYWREAAALIAATLLPWVTNLLYNLDVAGLGRVDLTPIAFAITAVVIVWGVFGRRLLGLSTTGRSVVLETMRDGMVVVDAFGRIVDHNRAAAGLLAAAGGRLLGQPVARVLPEYVTTPSGRDGLDEAGASNVHLRAEAAGEQREYEVARSALVDARDRRTGELWSFRDVTERVRAQAELHRLLGERSRIAQVLQDSLMPVALPDIPGLQVTARYRPGGDGSEIGGDLYDVLPLADGRWAVLLGDVSGKGAQAAAMTALVRYTVRALSGEPHSPRQMLSRLNDAMLRQATDERYATVAYCIVEPHGRGAHVSIALGGHPPALLVRECGHAEYVGRPGLMLGVLPDPELHDVEICLGPGDVLCLYTDGVTEARRGRELFGEDRLSSLLSSLAHRSADDIATGTQGHVEDFADTRRRDDLALVVVKTET